MSVALSRVAAAIERATCGRVRAAEVSLGNRLQEDFSMSSVETLRMLLDLERQTGIQLIKSKDLGTIISSVCNVVAKIEK